jgi:nucleotide-binding universal stress UspA family protein
VPGVVVGVQHAGTSGAAVRWASAAAALRGLPLTLVHAWDAPLEVAVALDPLSLPDLVGPATSRAVYGPAAAALLASKPDLLVLGSRHGRRHVTRLTRTCLYDAECPVVVIPDREPSGAERIAVGICGTAASRNALGWAVREAQLRHASLIVCYAWQLRPRSVTDLLLPTRALAVQQDPAVGRLRSWLHQELGPQQVDVQVTRAGPLDGLLEATAGADLLVVGRSVHAGLSRLLHGSVGNDLAALTPCAVAVIPSPRAATTARMH